MFPTLRTTIRVVGNPPPQQTALPGMDPEPQPDMPLDLREGAFAHPLGLPWLPDSCVPFANRQPDLAVGDAVRLIALPPQVAALPRATRRRWDAPSKRPFMKSIPTCRSSTCGRWTRSSTLRSATNG